MKFMEKMKNKKKKAFAYLLAAIMFVLVPMELLSVRSVLAKTIAKTSDKEPAEEKTIHELIEEKINLNTVGMASLISFDTETDLDGEAEA